jgi:hypothetical protein
MELSAHHQLREILHEVSIQTVPVEDIMAALSDLGFDRLEGAALECRCLQKPNRINRALPFTLTSCVF